MVGKPGINKIEYVVTIKNAPVFRKKLGSENFNHVIECSQGSSISTFTISAFFHTKINTET